MLLVNRLVEEDGLEQCKAEPCVFWLMVENEVSLMVGVHLDDIIVSGGKNACENFFAQLKERFPVKNQGELKMYTGCVSVRDWESGVPDCICGKPGSTVWNLRNLEHPR